MPHTHHPLIRPILLLLILQIINTHIIKEIPVEQKQIATAYINQPIPLSIPFQKCFKIQTQLDANKQYIEFKPTRITAQAEKSYSLKNQGSNINILQELRSPISYKHRHLLVFQGYLMVFFAPNVIIIIEQTSNGFVVKNRYFLQNLGRFDQFKLYKLGGKGMLVVYNKKTVYLLDKIGYEDYQLPDISTIIHLQQLNDLQFFAAEFMKGLTHYKLNYKTNRIQIIRNYSGNEIGIQQKLGYVVDLNLNFYEKDQIMYILDAERGLIELNVENKMAKVIVKHVMCQSFDTIQQNHIVMLCQNQGHSSIIQVYREKTSKGFSYRKVEPIFQQSYLNDLHVTDSYFLAYSSKSLKVFWNIKKNRLPQTLQTQSQLVLPGLQTFTLVRKNAQNYIYTIEAGELYKYKLIEKPASLQVKSTEVITKTFKIFLYGSCADLEATENKDTIQACKVNKLVQLRVTQQQYPREEDLGISASIVAILVMVFLLVIWICLKKYKGLQRQARKVLQAYQNKRLKQNRRI